MPQETSVCWFWNPGLRGETPGNQPKGSDEGLTDTPVPSSVSGDIRLLFLVEVVAQLVSDHPCVFRAAYTIGMASGILEHSPNLQVCGQWNGQSFLGEGRHSPVLWLQGPQC